MRLQYRTELFIRRIDQPLLQVDTRVVYEDRDGSNSFHGTRDQAVGGIGHIVDEITGFRSQLSSGRRQHIFPATGKYHRCTRHNQTSGNAKA